MAYAMTKVPAGNLKPVPKPLQLKLRTFHFSKLNTFPGGTFSGTGSQCLTGMISACTKQVYKYFHFTR
jgi:hypothetical protein